MKAELGILQKVIIQSCVNILIDPAPFPRKSKKQTFVVKQIEKVAEPPERGTEATMPFNVHWRIASPQHFLIPTNNPKNRHLLRG